MTTFKTTGTCSSEIIFDIENKTIKDVHFEGGCPGNAIGLASLIQGMNVDEAITRMQGIICGDKETSCPDQLAQALTAWKKNNT